MKEELTQAHKSHNVTLVQGCAPKETDTEEELIIQDVFKMFLW